MKEDWIEIELGKALIIERGGSPRPIKEFITDDENGINWIKIGDTKINSKYITNTAEKIKPDGLKKSRFVTKGDLLLSNSMSFGRPYILNTEGAIHDGWLVLRNATDFDVDSEFLYYVLSSPIVFAQFDKLATGSTVRNLNTGLVSRVVAPIAPLPIQRAIVTKIENLFASLDKGIADLKKAQEQLKIYRQAVLKKAFEGELTKEWREKQTNLPTTDELLEQIKEERQKHYEQQVEDWKQAVKTWEENGKEGKKPSKPKEPQYYGDLTDEELKGINVSGGFYTKMGNLSDVVRGGSPRPAGDERYYNGPIPFLKVADLTRKSGMYVDSYEYSIKKAGLQKTRLLKIGTLVISNSGATLGVPKITAIEATANDGIAAFLGLSKSRSEFLYHYWNSKTTALRAIDQGAGQPNLNTDLLKAYPVPVFSESEQFQIIKEIESRLSVCDKVELNISEALEKSEALRQSILKKAFEGKLLSETEIEKCKHEADYEPASVLLEKIKKDKKK